MPQDLDAPVAEGLQSWTPLRAALAWAPPGLIPVMDGGCCWNYQGNPSSGLPFIALGYPGAEHGGSWGSLDSSGPPP